MYPYFKQQSQRRHCFHFFKRFSFERHCKLECPADQHYEETITWTKTYVKEVKNTVYGKSPIRVLWVILLQYPALCVSLGLLLDCVRACSSWLSSVFRVSCKFSADTSAALMAPTASERKVKPTSIPAFLHSSPKTPASTQQPVLVLCVCVCVLAV